MSLVLRDLALEPIPAFVPSAFRWRIQMFHSASRMPKVIGVLYATSLI